MNSLPLSPVVVSYAILHNTGKRYLQVLCDGLNSHLSLFALCKRVVFGFHFTKLTSVFHASVLLWMLNFVITLKK